MAVRSYTPGKMAEETHKPRARINRDNPKTEPKNKTSKTQLRKANLPAHKKSCVHH